MIVSRSLSVPFQTEFSNGNFTAVADVPRDRGGDGNGFGPHDLLEAALATCMTITVQKYAAKHAIPLTGATCEVNLDRAVPNAVTFNYSLIFEGELTDEQRQLMRQSAGHCPVARTLTGATTVKSADTSDTTSEPTT